MCRFNITYSTLLLSWPQVLYLLSFKRRSTSTGPRNLLTTQPIHLVVRWILYPSPTEVHRRLFGTPAGWVRNTSHGRSHTCASPYLHTKGMLHLTQTPSVKSVGHATRRTISLRSGISQILRVVCDYCYGMVQWLMWGISSAEEPLQS